MTTISKRIFDKLKEYRMSQAEFSRQTGISTSTINDWKMKGHTPAADKILVICQVLEMTPEELLAEREKPVKLLDTESLKPGDRKMLDDYHSFTESQQKRLKSYMKRLLKENNVSQNSDEEEIDG
ncbi:MAG: helix-turn-helix domain-containing protein [Eubacterium sp.]|nr:helix-turn-helix domain-containing protein [Eubacterium sp.]